MALALAILMHWAVMLVFRSEEVSHVEGAGQGAPLEIGTSFLDLQVGTAEPFLVAATATRLEPPKLSDAERLGPDTAESNFDAGGKAELISPVSVQERKPSEAYLLPSKSHAVLDSEITGTQARPKARPESLRQLSGPSRKDNTDAFFGSSTKTTRASRSGGGDEPGHAASGEVRSGGRAAQSNYRGLINERIRRAPKPRSMATASAAIQFRIAPDGRISEIVVAKSSGSPRFDRDALNTVRGAAPFPPPPSGAGRVYNIVVSGR